MTPLLVTVAWLLLLWLMTGVGLLVWWRIVEDAWEAVSVRRDRNRLRTRDEL